MRRAASVEAPALAACPPDQRGSYSSRHRWRPLSRTPCWLLHSRCQHRGSTSRSASPISSLAGCTQQRERSSLQQRGRGRGRISVATSLSHLLPSSARCIWSPRQFKAGKTGYPVFSCPHSPEQQLGADVAAAQQARQLAGHVRHVTLRMWEGWTSPRSITGGDTTVGKPLRGCSLCRHCICSHRPPAPSLSQATHTRAWSASWLKRRSACWASLASPARLTVLAPLACLGAGEGGCVGGWV